MPAQQPPQLYADRSPRSSPTKPVEAALSHEGDHPRQRLADYCTRKGLDVIRVFELVESSTRGERKEFTAMLEFAKARKESLAIVADAVVDIAGVGRWIRS